MPRPTSRFALATLTLALFGLWMLVEAYARSSLDLAAVGIGTAALALPVGAIAVGRRLFARRRGLRYAVPGLLLSALIVAPVIYLQHGPWRFG